MGLLTKTMTIYTDGGSRHNPGPAAAAFIITTDSGQLVHKEGKYLGLATNNQAEYQAVFLALEWLSQNDYKNLNLDFFLDSLLVVNQLSGIFKIKDHLLRNLIIKIQSLIKSGTFNVKFTYIPRTQNYQADLLVNQTLDNQ